MAQRGLLTQSSVETLLLLPLQTPVHFEFASVRRGFACGLWFEGVVLWWFFDERGGEDGGGEDGGGDDGDGEMMMVMMMIMR